MKWCCCDVYVCQDWQCLGPNCHCCFDVDVVTNDVCNRLHLILDLGAVQKYSAEGDRRSSEGRFDCKYYPMTIKKMTIKKMIR